MAEEAKLTELISENIQELSEKEKREALSFIEYLKINEIVDTKNDRNIA